ncbi:EPS15 homology domain 1 [Perilla frutescens var. hirtella]|uniref:EPS15 homology domain 1 n=1 Tax=Perilla frutescens var. hirtella TaxID=608512 RepID=A0AAD4P054_PERFH|nr:EPS15 homology domain 1 [Perilla frutescens var. hirtella]
MHYITKIFFNGEIEDICHFRNRLLANSGVSELRLFTLSDSSIKNVDDDLSSAAIGAAVGRKVLFKFIVYEVKFSLGNAAGFCESSEVVVVDLDQFRNLSKMAEEPQVQSSPPTGWFNSSKSAKKVSLRFVTLIIDGLKKLYVHKLKHLEVNYWVNDFVSPLLSNNGFDAKPMVMLLAQYSTGKTTFIKHLLRTSYPGAHVGHEPTMDKFVAVMFSWLTHMVTSGGLLRSVIKRKTYIWWEGISM